MDIKLIVTGKHHIYRSHMPHFTWWQIQISFP